jgi:hypothetical protein
MFGQNRNNIYVMLFYICFDKVEKMMSKCLISKIVKLNAVIERKTLAF